MPTHPQDRDRLPLSELEWKRLIAASQESLRRAHAEGAAAHRLALAFEPFARAFVALVWRRAGDDGVPVSSERIAEIVSAPGNASDVYLAIACDEGVAGCWERLADCFLQRLERLARSRGVPASEAEELARDAIGDLSCPPPDGRARTMIGTFRAIGSLGAWLSVILVRRIVDRARSTRPEVRLSWSAADDPSREETREIVAPGPDPSSTVLDAETMKRVEAAFLNAWQELPGRDALAVQLRYRDDLPLKEISMVLGLSQSRASRVIQKAVDTLGERLKRSLVAVEPRRQQGGETFWKALEAAAVSSLAKTAAPSDRHQGHGHARTR
jgi:RNA polymerase sigma factor (sigma-70 family)